MTLRTWNFFSICVLVSGILWIGVSINPAGQGLDKSLSVPRQGFSAPDFQLETLDGDSIALSNLKGQAVIVNFWASWCQPCRLEMPAIQKAYSAFHAKGLEVLAVNATNQDDLKQAEAFVDEFNLTFPILIDKNGEVGKLYQVSAFPTTIFIQPDGIIHEVIIGGPMAEALLLTRIEKLLGMP
jgi:peroxiredoxin